MLRSNLAVGTAAALMAALLGTGWQLASRHGVTTTLGPLDLALLRYGLPALLLCPWWLRTGLLPRGVPMGVVALMVLGGGLPFGLLVLGGAQLAPAAHMGVFLAGTLPLFTALACRLVLGERVQGMRWFGLLLLAAGVSALAAHGWRSGEAGSWRGDLMFLLAALLWSAYTLAFRRSGLSPWQGAAVVNAWSALLLLPVLFWSGSLRLHSAPLGDVLFQALWQGVLAGVLGLVAFTIAVVRLGAARAALSAALVPPFTTFGAALLLGEALNAQTVLAALTVAAGVVLASGAVGVRKGETAKAAA